MEGSNVSLVAMSTEPTFMMPQEILDVIHLVYISKTSCYAGATIWEGSRGTPAEVLVSEPWRLCSRQVLSGVQGRRTWFIERHNANYEVNMLGIVLCL